MRDKTNTFIILGDTLALKGQGSGASHGEEVDVEEREEVVEEAESVPVTVVPMDLG